MMTLGPFDYSNMDEIDLLCRLPDQFIRQVWCEFIVNRCHEFYVIVLFIPRLTKHYEGTAQFKFLTIQ